MAKRKRKPYPIPPPKEYRYWTIQRKVNGKIKRDVYDNRTKCTIQTAMNNIPKGWGIIDGHN